MTANIKGYPKSGHTQNSANRLYSDITPKKVDVIEDKLERFYQHDGLIEMTVAVDNLVFIIIDNITAALVGFINSDITVRD